ncbi:diguanylate cyclase [Catenovulum agarivorans]|uniref:diguanylate cyclase n=1 Tax=Catenovulum agarivorans TaxID=1172192 RepID=UPI0002EA9D4C|nr:diguanylate cyclase [Catenovulum agarivorans]
MRADDSITTNKNRPCILVVDDQEINSVMLQSALSQLYEVYTASDGSQALEVLNKYHQLIDLVLLDIQMPNIDGYQVLLKIRQTDRFKNIPVIFITGKDSAEDEAKGLELGAMDYIPKPFNMSVVHARIRNQIALKKKSDLLEKLALLDGLTEIPNRRNYDETFIQEWRRAARSNSPISLIMLDIDYFKQYNDNYGHSLGDETLKAVAKCLSDQVMRSGDHVARYGGEEFAIILPNTELRAAASVAEKIRNAILQLAIPHEFSKVSDFVTVSLGVSSTIPTISDAYTVLQEYADQQLYKAKQAGRNRLVAEEMPRN